MALFRRKTKAQRLRKARENARKLADGTGKRLTLIPPEGVPLNLPLASLGQRLAGQVVDLIVTMMSAIVFAILLRLTFPFSWTLVFVALTLTFFFIRIPYYITTELMWNGQTLAKRWLGMRVVSTDGRSLQPHQIVIRNLMKEVEFFVPLIYAINAQNLHITFAIMAWIWIVILLVVPWRNRHNQRLGDIIAGTAVILDPKPVLLGDLTTSKQHAARVGYEERFIFSPTHLDQYGRFELQTLERILRSSSRARSDQAAAKRADYLRELADRIIDKIDYEEKIEDGDVADFLQSFYRAQRAHLESRKLYGDTREDKYFREINDKAGSVGEKT